VRVVLQQGLEAGAHLHLHLLLIHSQPRSLPPSLYYLVQTLRYLLRCSHSQPVLHYSPQLPSPESAPAAGCRRRRPHHHCPRCCCFVVEVRRTRADGMLL
jgi:hypothetical protein